MDDVESPLVNRVGSRMSQLIGPSSEPRAMRSSTSLGARPPSNLDVNVASTEHGRLLFEAYRSLESKLPADALGAITSFQSTARTSESINASIRNALQLATQIAIDVELDPGRIQEDFTNLTLVLRDIGRASDQNVRDLTRVMLDLPKLIRGGSQLSTTSASSGSLRQQALQSDTPRRWQPPSPSMYDSPVRRSEEVVRPATSMGNTYSPSSRGSRDSLPPPRSADRSKTTSTISSFVSKVRGLGTTPRKMDELDTIEASPPTGLPDVPRAVLRKKASVASTNTIRGSPFLPPASKIRTTTAISAVTAGQAPEWDGEISPTSLFSHHTAAEDHDSVVGSGIGLGNGNGNGSVMEGNAVAALEQVAKWKDGVGDVVVEGGGQGVGVVRRSTMGEGQGRKGGISERFRETLKRGNGDRAR